MGVVLRPRPMKRPPKPSPATKQHPANSADCNADCNGPGSPGAAAFTPELAGCRACYNAREYLEVWKCQSMNTFARIARRTSRKSCWTSSRRFPARSARASETPYSSPFSAPAMAPQTAHLQSLPGGFRAEAAAAAVVAPVIKSFSHSVFGCHLTCHRALSRSIYSSSLDSWGRSCWSVIPLFSCLLPARPFFSSSPVQRWPTSSAGVLDTAAPPVSFPSWAS